MANRIGDRVLVFFYGIKFILMATAATPNNNK